MNPPRRWDPCVIHRGRLAEQFMADFFAEPSRRVFFVAGAGFDPRATAAAENLGSVRERVTGLFIKEERPNPSTALRDRASVNLTQLEQWVASSRIETIEVFSIDGAVVGGRAVAQLLQSIQLEGFSDIVVDLSALSIGIGYPIVRLLFNVARLKAKNLHLLVSSDPELDAAISSTASDRVGAVHGFQGGFGLDKNARATKLWLPQLVAGQRQVLERIRAYVDPQEVCPILPFPARRPRTADELIEHYGDEFESTWEVDARNLVYADQQNPLDLYRSILLIDDARSQVFKEVGGSMLVLSPLANKLLGLGALMAAIERDFPVVYVEALGYELDQTLISGARTRGGELFHIWLSGEVYSSSIQDGREV